MRVTDYKQYRIFDCPVFKVGDEVVSLLIGYTTAGRLRQTCLLFPKPCSCDLGAQQMGKTRSREYGKLHPYEGPRLSMAETMVWINSLDSHGLPGSGQAIYVHPLIGDDGTSVDDCPIRQKHGPVYLGIRKFGFFPENGLTSGYSDACGAFKKRTRAQALIHFQHLQSLIHRWQVLSLPTR